MTRRYGQQAQVPPAVTAAYPGLPAHPTIAEVFHPDGRGWLTLRGLPAHVDALVTGGYRKRISTAYARKLRGEGVTVVALDLGDGRRADFTTAELCRRGTR